MRFFSRFCAVLAVICLALVVWASDRTAVYALIDKVVTEPNSEHPERIQVWGVFALAKAGTMDYLAPQRGYLYFRLGGDPATDRNEWADLQSVAGKKQVVAFGNRWMLSALSVRKPDAKPENPVAYATEAGIFKVRTDTSYAPVKSLIEFANR